MYRAWQEDTSPGTLTDVYFPHDDWVKVIEYDFIDSASLCTPFPCLTFKSNNFHAPADYFECGSMHIVSEHFVELMIEFKVSAEYHLVRMFHQNMETRKQYFLMHILQSIDCVDRELSNIDIDSMDYIDDFKTLIFNEDKLTNFTLVRVGKMHSDIVLVRNDLAEAILQRGLTGIKFSNISEIKSLYY
ncbi:MAG: Imm43 family immunity protein [Thiohalomonadales bacterium]